MTKLEEIKLEELKFVKQQEHFVDQKLNIIAVISGIFISGSFVFISTNYNSLSTNGKIWFFIFTGISVFFLFMAVFPKIFFSTKNKEKQILNELPPKHNLYKKEYQGWEIDLMASLKTQIKLSRQFLKNKTFFCRTLIIIEPLMFLGIVLLFAFYF